MFTNLNINTFPFCNFTNESEVECSENKNWFNGQLQARLYLENSFSFFLPILAANNY